MEFDHGVNNTLRMYHHLNLINTGPKQLISFDHLQALIHHRGRIDGNLRPHLPVWMIQRLLNRRLGHVLLGPFSKRTARARQQDAPQIGRLMPMESLKNGTMLTVHRDHLPPSLDVLPHHEIAGHHQGFFIGQSHINTRLDRA